MSKNLIYTTAIDHNTSEFRNTDYSQYCIASWTAWCKKNNIDFMAITKHDDRYKYPVWNKDLIFDLVGDKYDKIIYVDSDTMIKWDAPNPFELYTEDDFCGAIDRSSLRWIINSIQEYGKFFPGIKLDLQNYFNSGVCFFSKKHKHIFEELKELLDEHWKEIASNLEGIKLNPYTDYYFLIQEKGALHILTIRQNNKIIGYLVTFLYVHPHYQDHRFGQNDLFYIKPEHRKGSLAMKTIKRHEEEMIKLGVDSVTYHMKPKKDFSALLIRQGHHLHETVYRKDFV